MSGSSPQASTGELGTWAEPGRTKEPFLDIQELPNELILAIFEQATVGDQFNLALLCRKFRGLATTALWHAAQWRLDWYPMFFGAAKGDIRQLEDTLRQGGPVNMECEWFY